MHSIGAAIAHYGKPGFAPSQKSEHETIRDILKEFESPKKKVSIKMDGSFNKQYHRTREMNDSDIMERIQNGRRSYHMSAYNYVKEPQIVIKNRKKSMSTIRNGRNRYHSITPSTNLTKENASKSSKVFSRKSSLLRKLPLNLDARKESVMSDQGSLSPHNLSQSILEMPEEEKKH